MLGKKADAEGNSSSSTVGPRWDRGMSLGIIAETWTWGTEGSQGKNGDPRAGPVSHGHLPGLLLLCLKHLT